MAAVGCMERDSGQEGEEGREKDGTKVFDFYRKNGVNHNGFYEDKSNDCIPPNGVILEKLCKLNGSVKPISFTKPSIPTLRSRGERVSAGHESPRRKRRPSKQDKSEPNHTFVPEESPVQCRIPCVDLFAEKDGENSLSDEKEISRLAEGECSNAVTPDTSRSCTPSSINCVLSPISKDSRSADTQYVCKETPQQCKWTDCDTELDQLGILDHIKKCHVDSQSGEKFVCLWEGCKVYDKKSCSRSWLERHILSHSGQKPFRCIVDGCLMRFTSQKMLERHVNSHFNTQQLPNQKLTKCREDTPTKSWKRRKVKRSRPPGVRPVDFFDSGIMEKLQQEISCITEHTQIDLNGSSNSVTFHSSIIARRTEESGKMKVLLHWTPEDVIPDSWVLESEIGNLQSCIIPLSKLPRQTVNNLHPSLYRRHRYRKHRRK